MSQTVGSPEGWSITVPDKIKVNGKWYRYRTRHFTLLNSVREDDANDQFVLRFINGMPVLLQYG